MRVVVTRYEEFALARKLAVLVQDRFMMAVVHFLTRVM